MAGTHEAPVSRILLGTYTDPVGTTPGAKGIYTCSWNPTTGQLGPIELAIETPDPSFLAISPKAPGMLFAVNELPGDHNGTVTAFAYKSGQPLRTLNVVSSEGLAPCDLTLDHTGRTLFVADYTSGCLATFKVTRAGLSKAVSVLRFPGHSIDPDRQTSAHTHCTLLSPDNRFLLVNDLGLDRIMVFHVNPVAATLTPTAIPYNATPGSGPRHSIFHPNGRWVYSVNEISSTVDLLDWASSDGTLTRRQTISSLPPNTPKQKNAPAELATDRAGKFLYVSNRFHDSIGVFAIDHKTGALTHRQDIDCGGKTPRHFVIDPTGRWLIVANQDSRNIVVFQRDTVTGELSATGNSSLLDAPVCILFV